jgi:hypothetical protein|tara:strand:- start:530 stop:697 length:168 start_codon:yes stop_codon:yes gene_type:complete
MKLLKTIIEIVTEAEDLYNKATSEVTDAKDIEILENNLDESLRLFQIYDEIKKED